MIYDILLAVAATGMAVSFIAWLIFEVYPYAKEVFSEED